jgi:NADH-quinone oxidoreductase subunit N
MMGIGMVGGAHPTSFWLPSLEAMAYIAPLLGLVGTIVAILLAALVVGRNAQVAAFITILGAAVTAVLCFRTTPNLALGGWAGFAPEGGAPMLIIDNFAILLITLVCFFLACVVGLWTIGAGSGGREGAAHLRDAPEFFTLLVGSAFGMALMVSTTNLLMIILAIEMASLPSYAIVGFRKRNRLASEASLKYVLFGAVTTSLMIYGVSLLYGFYGTLDLVSIGRMIAGDLGTEQVVGTNLLMAVAFIGLVAGVGFKISAVPFHFWCPDVFEGATIEVTTWLSVASKAAGLGLLLRVVATLTEPLGEPLILAQMSFGLAVFAAVTCTVGNLAAFRQDNIKRLLAYSSIAHAGYMLMAAAILWQPAATTDAVHPAFSALIAYIIVYLFMNLGAFGCAAMVFWATGRETLDAFHGLGRRSPLLAVSMVICLFSLVGLPPLGGFIAKFYLLWSLYDGGLVWLVIVAVINTLISLYYYARVAYAMYFVDDGQPVLAAPLFGRAVLAVVAVVLILTGAPLAGGLKARADQFASHLYPFRQRPTAVESTLGQSRPESDMAAQSRGHATHAAEHPHPPTEEVAR